MKRGDKIKASGDENDRKRWIYPLAMVTLWCSPAVAINITHGLQGGREPALIVAAVFSVFGAAACALRLEQQGSALGKLVTVGCLAVLLTYNFSNAVGLSAGHRDSARNDALTQQTVRASLSGDEVAIKSTISKLDHELGSSSLASLKTEIAAAEYNPLFSRSRKCTDATALESRSLCSAWERAKAMLAAAEQREQLAADLGRITAQLRQAPVRESVDAQAEALVRALAFAGLAADPRDVGYALVLLFALGIELMAAFGASWCGVQLPRRAPAAAPQNGPRTAGTARRTEGAPDADASASAPEGDPLASFVADLVKSDRTTSFKVLFAAYEDRCKAAGVAPKSKRALALALGGEQFTKSNLNGGEVHYGVQMRKRLSVVAAA